MFLLLARAANTTIPDWMQIAETIELCGQGLWQIHHMLAGGVDPTTQHLTSPGLHLIWLCVLCRLVETSRPPPQTGQREVCLQDESPDVRQSAFALVGDLAKLCAPHLAPVAGDLIRLGMAQLEPAAIRQETMSACNNACWSLGEHPFMHRSFPLPCPPRHVFSFYTSIAAVVQEILADNTAGRSSGYSGPPPLPLKDRHTQV